MSQSFSDLTQFWSTEYWIWTLRFDFKLSHNISWLVKELLKLGCCFNDIFVLDINLQICNDRSLVLSKFIDFENIVTLDMLNVKIYIFLAKIHEKHYSFILLKETNSHAVQVVWVQIIWKNARKEGILKAYYSLIMSYV